MCFVYEGSSKSDVLQVEQEIECARKSAENRVEVGWNKMNQMWRNCPNEETEEKGKPTEKYKEEKSIVKKLERRNESPLENICKKAVK